MRHIHLGRDIYKLVFGPGKYLKERSAQCWLFSHEIESLNNLGLHEVTRFLVTSVVLQSGPCDFPAGHTSYPPPPPPHLYRLIALCNFSYPFSPPLSTSQGLFFL